MEETVAGATVAGELRGAERRQVGLLQGVGERLSIAKNKFRGNVFFTKISRIFNTLLCERDDPEFKLTFKFAFELT